MFRIMRYLSKAEIGQMLIALVSIVGQIWLDLTLPDYMSDITTLVETPGSEMHDIWIAGGKMLLISLGSAACAIITGYFAARIGASFSQRLRSMEFRKVESFGPAEMSRFSTASLITRSTNDITQIQMFITMGLMMIVKSPIMAVWAVCKIAGDGLEWTLATGIAVVVLLVSITILMVLVMPKFKSMQRLTDNINLVARENLTGLRVVRAYNAEDYQEAKFTKANKELTDTQLFTNRAMAFMMPLMNTIMNGLMLAVYWIGAYLIDAADAADKLTTFSNMVVFSSYSVQVIMSFLLMSMVFVLWPRADVSAQRVLEVRDTDPETLEFEALGPCNTPCFRRGQFDRAAHEGAVYLDVSGWGMGEVWINGHYLGSFWDEEKQQSILIPAEILAEKGNRIVVFDLKNNDPGATMRLSDKPVFK